ncbi:MAG TPA: hypothetical protein PLP61_05000 [Nocardioides sp.]|nr:hypothetical protein [Nocardioides sp.]
MPSVLGGIADAGGGVAAAGTRELLEETGSVADRLDVVVPAPRRTP